MKRSEMKKMLSVILLATLLLALVACKVPVVEEARAPEERGEAPVAEGPVSAEIASTAGLDEALELLDLVE